MSKRNYDKDAVIAQLKKENRDLEVQVTELKYILNDVKAINDAMREDIEKEVAAECGCVVIEGNRTSAAYQDLVGILLANNYTVEVIPMDDRRKLKIIIKESEV
ncbi:MAG: hypothetical protein ACLUCE_10925 [Streptococcus sp.]|jgi:hypothetical protein|uniref:hypothetical protein n=1 Tax=Streptococcus sp. TaxID=1306 RepID=UPI00399505FB